MAYKVKKTPKKTYTRHSGLTIFGKVLKGLVILSLLGAILGSLFLGNKFLDIARGAPDADIEKFLSLSQESVLLDDQGQIMDRVITDEVSRPVKIAQMSKALQNAFIATEDERFYSHHGVDFRRTIGVTLRYGLSKIVGGNYSQGGSTLTQQLIKNIFLTRDQTESRKIQEMYLALQIEKKVPKEKILETYLNSIFLGGRAYGVEAAAQQYFSKSAKDLGVIESAYLAGVTQAPSEYFAFTEENKKNPSLYENRTKTVLDQMTKNGFLTPEENKKYAKQIDQKGIPFKYTTLINGGVYHYDYFTRPVVSQVIADLMASQNISREKAKEQLSMGGYRIYTTMNRAFQEHTLKEIDNKENYRFKEYTDEHGIIQPQVSAVITEPSTGHVKAIVGGRGEQVVGGPNRASSRYFLRSIGSATKPLTAFTPGIDQKIFNAATPFEDSPLSLEERKAYFFGEEGADPKDPKYPGNSYRSWYGLTDVKDALRRSSNLVAIKAVKTTGLALSQDYAQRFGLVLPPESHRGISMYALGQYANIDGEDGGNPLIMASAYGTFVNHGVKNKSILYTKVLDPAGKVVLENKTRGDQIIQPGTAYIMWDVLKNVVTSDSLSVVKFSDMPVGGKTGTSQDSKELWFAGTTPYYSCAVLIAGDDYKTIIDRETDRGMSSAVGGLKVWSKIMKLPHEGKALKEVPVPSDVVKVPISYDSGTLPTDLTRRDPRGDRTREAWFLRDMVPKTFDNIHVEADINRITGKLATASTPPGLRVKRVFIRRDYNPEVPLADDPYVLPRGSDPGPGPGGYTVPVTKPPVTKPENTQPPSTQPPTTQPPTTQPPNTQPPSTQPPSTQPPTTQPPSTQPPTTQPPGTKPPSTKPSNTKP
ncbi:Multimodular transpeptidase-transglycosylase [Clostridiaceae bacterium JG1575]|nr:Multimodular transpeptidase-transglycosylase [Clostridiaceae bacterium JG1575]